MTEALPNLGQSRAPFAHTHRPGMPGSVKLTCAQIHLAHSLDSPMANRLALASIAEGYPDRRVLRQRQELCSIASRESIIEGSGYTRVEGISHLLIPFAPDPLHNGLIAMSLDVPIAEARQLSHTSPRSQCKSQ